MHMKREDIHSVVKYLRYRVRAAEVDRVVDKGPHIDGMPMAKFLVHDFTGH